MHDGLKKNVRCSFNDAVRYVKSSQSNFKGSTLSNDTINDNETD